MGLYRLGSSCARSRPRAADKFWAVALACQWERQAERPRVGEIGMRVLGVSIAPPHSYWERTTPPIVVIHVHPRTAHGMGTASRPRSCTAGKSLQLRAA